MLVKLERGDKDVELELHLDMYKTAERDSIFLGLMRDALQSLGYSELDLIDAFKSKPKDDK